MKQVSNKKALVLKFIVQCTCNGFPKDDVNETVNTIAIEKDSLLQLQAQEVNSPCLKYHAFRQHMIIITNIIVFLTSIVLWI